MINLVAFKLGNDSGWWARPTTGMGTMGWHPFPWELTYGKTAEQARQNFLKNHAKYIEESE